MTEEHTINLQPGAVIGGKYEVVKCLGSGSMGSVYACKNQVLQGQIVAMKVLFPEVATDKVAAARFKNEILAAYEVSHPNVVRAYEYLTDRDFVAYTMEFVGGGDLASKLGSDERIPIPEIIRLLSQMSAGCQAIHDAGIVHRDLKPENILLTAEGNVKIADFGIARNRHGPKLTEHGGVVGTIDYVAPEYMLKSQVDWRSDIYALGILAYEMVTGDSPFKGESVYATMTKRLKTDPEPPSSLREECPPELDRIILKAMQREPERRYQASIDMFRDLQSLAVEMELDSGGLVSPVNAGHSSSVSQRRATPSEVVGDGERAALMRALMEIERILAEASEWRASQTLVCGPLSRRSSPPTQHMAGRSRVSEGRGLEEPLSNASVETDVPYSASEPLVSNYQEANLKERSAEFRPARSKSGARRNSEKDSHWGEILVLVFAAAVGIGCGFMFLKLFAPSLLAKWHF